MVGTAAALGIGAGLGVLGGALGNHSSQDLSSGVNAGQATGFENYGQGLWQDNTSQLSNMVGAGPGQSDVAGGYGAQKDLADMLKQYSQNGGQPTGDDINRSNSFAQSIFNPQRVALQQNFLDQSYAANQQAALSGRDANDPILRNKLATEQSRQMAQLGSQQGAYASQYAQQMPMQRLGFMQDHANVMGGLATQAMANRQALAAMGNGIMTNQQNYRLATASHFGQQSTQSGGGWGGAITGGIAGMGVGLGMARGINSLGPQTGLPESSGMGSYFGGSNPYSQGSGASFGGFGGTPSYSLMGNH